MKYIEIKDSYAVKNSSTVEEYVKNDGGMLIAVPDNYYAPLVRDICALLKKQPEDITNTYIDEIGILVEKYHGEQIKIDKTISYQEDGV